MSKSMKNLKAKYAIPKGYDVCASDGMSESVDWDKTPIVEGELLEMKTIAGSYTDKKTGKKNKTETRLAIIKTKSGVVAVWEKKMLEVLFNAVEPGDNVYIAHLGMQAIKGRAQQMHVFATAYRK